MTPCQAHWVLQSLLLGGAKAENFFYFLSSCQWVSLSRQRVGSAAETAAAARAGHRSTLPLAAERDSLRHMNKNKPAWLLVTRGKSARQVYLSEKFFKENILKSSLRTTMKDINFQFFYGLTFFEIFLFKGIFITKKAPSICLKISS